MTRSKVKRDPAVMTPISEDEIRALILTGDLAPYRSETIALEQRREALIRELRDVLELIEERKLLIRSPAYTGRSWLEKRRLKRALRFMEWI